MKAKLKARPIRPSELPSFGASLKELCEHFGLVDIDDERSRVSYTPVSDLPVALRCRLKGWRWLVIMFGEPLLFNHDREDTERAVRWIERVGFQAAQGVSEWTFFTVWGDESPDLIFNHFEEVDLGWFESSQGYGTNAIPTSLSCPEEHFKISQERSRGGNAHKDKIIFRGVSSVEIYETRRSLNGRDEESFSTYRPATNAAQTAWLGKRRKEHKAWLQVRRAEQERKEAETLRLLQNKTMCRTCRFRNAEADFCAVNPVYRADEGPCSDWEKG